MLSNPPGFFFFCEMVVFDGRWAWSAGLEARVPHPFKNNPTNSSAP